MCSLHICRFSLVSLHVQFLCDSLWTFSSRRFWYTQSSCKHHFDICEYMVIHVIFSLLCMEQPGKVHLIHLFLGNGCDCAYLDNSLLFNLFLPVGLPWLNPLLIVISWLEGMGLEVGTSSTSLSLEMAIGMVLLCPAIRGREGRGGGENSLEALVMLLVVEVTVVVVAAAVVMTSMSGSLANSGWVPKVFRVPLWD